MSEKFVAKMFGKKVFISEDYHKFKLHPLMWIWICNVLHSKYNTNLPKIKKRKGRK